MKNRIPEWRTVELELHSFCNRSCSFCPRYYDRSGIRKNKDGVPIKKEMPSEKVYEIIDWLYDYGYKGKISFHRLSEPLLDKRYLEFVKYAHSKDLKVFDHTNGDVLKNNETLCSELDGFVDTFKIGLYNYKNYKQKQEVIDFWKSRFKKTKIEFSTPLEDANIRQNSEIYKILEKDQKILQEPCSVGRLTGIYIRYDGEISLCCQDDNCEFNLGNVFEKTISTIWWSDKHEEIFNNLLQENGRMHYALCKKCYLSNVKTNSLYTRAKKKIAILLWKKNLIGIKRLAKYNE